MSKTITVTPTSEWMVLKVIRVIGPKWNPFTANFSYKRILTPSYNWNNGDVLDTALLECIQKAYPDSKLGFSKLVIFNDELQDNLRWLKMASTKKITINFFPYLGDSQDELQKLVGKRFTSYQMDFNWDIDLNELDIRTNQIHPAELCYVDYKQLNDLIDTIKPLN